MEWREAWRKKEKELLVNIKKGFINDDIAVQRNRMRSAEIVLDAINNKKVYYDSLAYHIHKVPIFPNPDISFTPYELLKSTRFDLIKNVELKDEILL